MGLESTTSTDATLMLTNIFPASFQIIKRLLRFMLRKHRANLTASMVIPSRFYVSPASIGATWFRRLWKSDLRVPTVRVRRSVSRAVATVVFSRFSSGFQRFAGRMRLVACADTNMVGPWSGSVDTTRRQSVEGTRETQTNAVDTIHNSQAKNDELPNTRMGGADIGLAPPSPIVTSPVT